MSEYLTSDLLGSREVSSFMGDVKSDAGERKSCFVCGQSVLDFDSFDVSSTVLLDRPDGKLTVGNLETLREQYRAILKWLNFQKSIYRLGIIKWNRFRSLARLPKFTIFPIHIEFRPTP